MFKPMMTAFFALMISNATFGLDVDPTTSSFKWSATKKVGNGHQGIVKLQTQKSTFNDKGELQSGEYVIDLGSMEVTDLEGEWRDKFLTHVKGADFFDVGQYPTAKLVLSSIKGSKASGELTIKGKTQKVTFDVAKSADSYQGKLVFDRTKFGIVYGAGNFFKELTADKIINNDVTVEFNVTLKK